VLESSAAVGVDAEWCSPDAREAWRRGPRGDKPQSPWLGPGAVLACVLGAAAVRRFRRREKEDLYMV